PVEIEPTFLVAPCTLSRLFPDLSTRPACAGVAHFAAAHRLALPNPYCGPAFRPRFPPGHRAGSCWLAFIVLAGPGHRGARSMVLRALDLHRHRGAVLR